MKSLRSSISKVRKVVVGLLRERCSPARLGWAVGVGVFIGLTPFYGLHLAMCLVVATVFGLNRVVTFLAANITNPLFFPFLAFFSIQIGHLVLNGSLVPLTFNAFRELDLMMFGGAWIIGSLVLGVGLGFLLGAATYVGARIYRVNNPMAADLVGEAMSRVVRRYRVEGRTAAGFVRGKLRADPVSRQIGELCPVPAPVTDFGCGRGQLALLIAELQPESKVFGIDWDGEKMETATRAAGESGVVLFETADLRTTEIPASGSILMVDVLHYHAVEIQDEMLERAAQALLPGGLLLIRDLDDIRGWRSRVTIWQERFAKWTRLHRGTTLCFRSADSIRHHLEDLGLEVEVSDSSEGLPFGNVLILAKKPVEIEAKPAA